MRARAFPFGKAFREFVDDHERIFVIEQNRDGEFRRPDDDRARHRRRKARLRGSPPARGGVDAFRGRGGGSYDGMPITADNIFRQIKGKMMQEI